MGERNLNFDDRAERRNTKSLKYDFAAERGKPENVLPLWVADMDFKVSSYITDALGKMVEHGIFGYSEADQSYVESVRGWMRRRYDWEVQPEWLIKTPGIVFALAMAVRAFTKEGDGVLIQKPVYYPFSEVILDNHRRVINNALVQNEDGSYQINFADFEKKIVEEKVKLFLLCNPHNPVGRVWTREELVRMGDICRKHHVLVVSDEIHADFVWERKHEVFLNLKAEYQENSIVCTSPSKTFNLAGLQVSNIFIANEKLAAAFRREVNAAGYSQLNLAGLVACEAAYRQGEEWFLAVSEYIRGNAVFVKRYLEQRLPKVTMTRLEGTYLVWLDFRAYGLSDEELERRLLEEAGVWLDSGRMFGREGEGFQRINIACPRSLLQEALDRIASAFG